VLLEIGEVYALAVRVEAELAERARMLDDQHTVARCERAAAALLDKFEAYVEQATGDRPPPESVAYLNLARAELTRLRAERDPRPWNTAAERFRAVGLAYSAAYADLRAAEALALLGARMADVAVPLRSAHAIALDVGSPWLLAEVLALGRRAGVPLGAAQEDQQGDVVSELGLTDRELEVLRLLRDGRTNRQIGEELFITAKTASVHVSRILMKLGVSNRAEAAAAAHRMGLARHVAVDQRP
jgi:DNA-binding CsgD family transcriptional regulator